MVKKVYLLLIVVFSICFNVFSDDDKMRTGRPKAFGVICNGNTNSLLYYIKMSPYQAGTGGSVDRVELWDGPIEW